MTSNVSPASLGITPTTSPEVLEVLDNNGNWVPIGSVAGGAFTPVGGGAPSGGGGNAFDTIAGIQATSLVASVQGITCGGVSAAGDLLGFFMAFKRVAAGPATWTGIGTITGNTLTIVSTTAGAPAIGQTLTGAAPGTFITGGAGSSWTVSVKQTISTATGMTGTPAPSPTGIPFVRSADRFLPNGTTDGANGGWWKLVNSIVTPEMFGAKRDATTDDYVALQSMINYAESNQATGLGGNISSVACAFSPGTYQCNTGLSSQSGAKYFVPAASEAGFQAGTFVCSIRFPAAFAGPWGWRVKDSGGGGVCTFENLTLIYNTGAPSPGGAFGPGGPAPAPIHGWQLERIVRMRACTAGGWPGNGFHINGASDGNGFDGTIGFADGSRFELCWALNNGWNGFFGYGADFNVCTFDQCSSIQNQQWGFREQGFLGNVYVNCHTAINGQPNFAIPSMVTFGGKTYAVYPWGPIVNSSFALTWPSIVDPVVGTSTSLFDATILGTALTIVPGSVGGTVNRSQTLQGQNIDVQSATIQSGSGLNWVLDSSHTVGATFNGSLSGTILTITSAITGSLTGIPAFTYKLVGASVLPFTYLTTQIDATHWNINNSHSAIASEPMVAAGSFNAVASIYSLISNSLQGGVQPWTAGVLYQSGGAYFTGSTMVRPYAEDGQGPHRFYGQVIDRSSLGQSGDVPYIGGPMTLPGAGLHITMKDIPGNYENIDYYLNNTAGGINGTGVFTQIQGSKSGIFLYQLDPAIRALNCLMNAQVGGWYITSGYSGGPSFGLATPPAGIFAVPGLGIGMGTTGMGLQSGPAAPGNNFNGGQLGKGWFTFATGAAVTAAGLLGWQCIASPSTQIALYGAQVPIYGASTIAALPAAATAGIGARAFVNNSSQTASGNFGAALSATTGANKVPVYSDGANWFIG